MDKPASNAKPQTTKLPAIEVAFRIVFPFRKAASNWAVFAWALLCVAAFAWAYVFRSNAIDAETRKNHRLFALESQFEELQSQLSQSMLDELAVTSRESLGKFFSSREDAKTEIAKLSRSLATSEWTIEVYPSPTSVEADADQVVSTSLFELSAKRTRRGAASNDNGTSAREIANLLQSLREWPNALEVDTFKLMSDGSQLSEISLGLVANHIVSYEEVFK